MKQAVEMTGNALKSALARVANFPPPKLPGEKVLVTCADGYDDYSDSVYVDSPYDDYQDYSDSRDDK